MVSKVGGKDEGKDPEPSKRVGGAEAPVASVMAAVMETCSWMLDHDECARTIAGAYKANHIDILDVPDDLTKGRDLAVGITEQVLRRAGVTEALFWVVHAIGSELAALRAMDEVCAQHADRDTKIDAARRSVYMAGFSLAQRGDMVKAAEGRWGDEWTPRYNTLIAALAPVFQDIEALTKKLARTAEGPMSTEGGS